MSVQAELIEIGQIGIVVRDLEKTMAQYQRLLGWGPWDIYEYRSPWLHDTEIHGRAIEYTMLGAEALVGNLMVELIQPLTGPSIYAEWLESKGEGLHHILVGWAGDYQSEPGAATSAADTPGDGNFEQRSSRLRRRFADEGIGVLMAGRLGQDSQFYYLDTEPVLKVIVESGGATARDLIITRRFPID
jgi:methylmalonyl-CoA/ethylmalonyl-CoA epimerase